ncbi:MAG: hypothetical protein H8F28_25050, partial [Fibrella sp.]|nr:hypothetical protein [Armatimonadota bacterium]
MKLLSYVLLTASLVSTAPSLAKDVTTLAALETPPVQVAITADGSKLFAVDPAEASVQVWNMATGDLIRVFPAPGAVGPVAILADGRLAVAVRKAVGPMLLGTPPLPEPLDSVNILSADGKPVGITLLFPDTNLRRSITSLAVTPDGKKLIASTYSLTRRTGRTDGEILPLNNRLPAQYGEIAAWTLADPKRPAEWLARYKGSGIGRIATLGPKAGLAMFSNGSVPPSLFTYQATAGTPLINIPNFGGRPIGGDQTPVPTALSPDGKWIAAATRDRLTVRPADSEAGSDSEKEILVRGPIRDVVSLTFLPKHPAR